jgi:signal transduction histidine kinase
MSASVAPRGLLPNWNAGVFGLPADDLVEIATWLDTSRCLTATVLIAISLVLQQTLLPDLPIGFLVGLGAIEIVLTVPYRRWIRTRRHLGILIYTQFFVDILAFTAGLSIAPELSNEFHFLYLMMIVPCALFSMLSGLVMATVATTAHLWLTPVIEFSMPVVVPVVVFFLVAQQSRFYGDRLVAKNRDAETGARMAEALLTVVRALAAAPTSGSLLQRVTEMARELTGSSWACVVVRDPQRGTYRVGGLASRTGTLDEEIKSVDFRAQGIDTALAELPTDQCLIVRTPSESPIAAILSARWQIGPFYGAALRRGTEGLGMLLLGQDDPATAFDPATGRLLSGIAHQTVLALDNARLVDELRAASSLKSEFIGTMSHELRSPLNAILGYTELLRDEARASPGDPEAAARDDTLGRVRFYALQLLEMIQATLDVSRLEAGRMPLHSVPIDLHTFISELRAGIPEYWYKPGVALEWSTPPSLPIVEVDGPKLVTIVRNLVHNALKFTDQGRVVVHAHVEVSTADAEHAVADRLIVTVTDTGIGIPQEQLGVIFEMFRQADGSDSRRHGGVGLGLYIVMRLAQALGGTVRVDSVPGAGATFTVAIPVQIGRAIDATRAAS